MPLGEGRADDDDLLLTPLKVFDLFFLAVRAIDRWVDFGDQLPLCKK